MCVWWLLSFILWRCWAMASALDRFIDAPKGAASTARDLKAVTAYRADLRRDSKGNPGVRIAPILSDGSEGRFGDLWIRLAEGPATLRAFVASLPTISQALKRLDAAMVAEGEWKAAPAADAAPAAAPAAAKAAPKAAKAAPAPAPAAPAAE